MKSHRKSIFITLLALCCFGGAFQSACALGLGEITNHTSQLNEPLNAEIAILGTEGLQVDEIQATLASQEDFDQLGVSRDFILTTLRFFVDLDAQPAVIRVTTEKPVQEPFLDFVLEVRTPDTRLLKGYTILLSPP